MAHRKTQDDVTDVKKEKKRCQAPSQVIKILKLIENTLK